MTLPCLADLLKEERDDDDDDDEPKEDEGEAYPLEEAVDEVEERSKRPVRSLLSPGAETLRTTGRRPKPVSGIFVDGGLLPSSSSAGTPTTTTTTSPRERQTPTGRVHKRLKYIHTWNYYYY